VEHEAGRTYRVHVYAGGSSSMHCAWCQTSKMDMASIRGIHGAFMILPAHQTADAQLVPWLSVV